MTGKDSQREDLTVLTRELGLDGMVRWLIVYCSGPGDSDPERAGWSKGGTVQKIMVEAEGGDEPNV